MVLLRGKFNKILRPKTKRLINVYQKIVKYFEYWKSYERLFVWHISANGDICMTSRVLC